MTRRGIERAIERGEQILAANRRDRGDEYDPDSEDAQIEQGIELSGGLDPYAQATEDREFADSDMWRPRGR